MKRVLALDTSTWWGSVAAVERRPGSGRPRVVAELGERIDGSHSELLVVWIERVLVEAGWPKTSVDAYAATRGPGSFTGIRVGLGVLRGLGLATDRPCFGVTTLEAIAEAHGPDDHERLPVMDAGRGELYAAIYDPRSSPPEEREAAWLDRAAAVLAAAGAAGATIITGPGTRLAGGPRPAGAIHPAPERLASATGRIASLREGAPEPLAPLYIRPPDALLKRSRP